MQTQTPHSGRMMSAATKNSQKQPGPQSSSARHPPAAGSQTPPPPSTQTESTQFQPRSQASPHPPQWAGSEVVSLQDQAKPESQHRDVTSPAHTSPPHVHSPPTHSAATTGSQTLPQSPQLSSSRSGFTQT